MIFYCSAANRHAIKTIVLSINMAFKHADVEVSTHIDLGLRDSSVYHGVYRLKNSCWWQIKYKRHWNSIMRDLLIYAMYHSSKLPNNRWNHEINQIYPFLIHTVSIYFERQIS